MELNNEALNQLNKDLSNRNLRSVTEWVVYFRERILPLNPEWTNLSDTDIGMLIVRLIGSIGDSLNWRIDMAELEFFIDSVRERSNAQSILRLVGYSMPTFISGSVEVKLSTTNGQPITQALTIPKYSRLMTKDRSLVYHTLSEYVMLPNTQSLTFRAHEGSHGSEIHDSVDIDSLGRLFLNDSNGSIAQNTVDVVYNGIDELTRVDDVYSTTGVREFQLMVDNYGHNYIQLDTNWRSYINTVTPTPLKVTYLVSKGEVDGMIGSGAITELYIAPDYDKLPDQVYKVTNTSGTSGASNPETIESARDNVPKYVRSMSTYVTIQDYEDGIELSHPDVIDVSVVDINTPGMGIDEPYKLKCFILTKDRGTTLPDEIKSVVSKELDSKRLATIQYQLLPPTKIVVDVKIRLFMDKLPASVSTITSEASGLIRRYEESHLIGDNFSPSKLGALFHNEFKYSSSVNYVDLDDLSQVQVNKGQVISINNIEVEVRSE